METMTYDDDISIFVIVVIIFATATFFSNIATIK